GVAYVGIEAPDGVAGNDVRTLAQEIRGRFPQNRPAVVAVAATAGGKASLVVTVNSAGRERGLAAVDGIKGAPAGGGGGSPGMARGGGLPAAEASGLLATVEKIVAAHGA